MPGPRRTTLQAQPAPPLRLDEILQLAAEHDRASAHMAKRRVAMPAVLPVQIRAAFNTGRLPHLPLCHAPPRPLPRQPRSHLRLLKPARGRHNQTLKHHRPAG
jgi:hypothetical protein